MTLLIVGVSLLVVTAIGFVIVFNVISGRQLASVLIARIVERDLQSVEDVIVGHIKRGQDRASSIARQVGLEMGRGTSGEDLTRILRGMISSEPNVARVTVHDALRPALQVERAPGDDTDAVGRSFFPSEPTPDVRADMGFSPAAGIALSLPYFDKSTGETLVNYRMGFAGKPIEQSWVDVEIYISPPLRLLSADPSEDASTGFALLDGRMVVAHPLLRTARTSLEKPLPDIADLGDPVMAGLPTAGVLRGFDSGAFKRARLLRVETNGDTYMVALREPAMVIGGHSLSVGVYNRANEIREPLQHFLRSTGIGLVILAIALAVAWILARLIARPIDQVSHSASEIEHIAFNSLDRLPRSRVREIDQLARAFNAMIDSLRLFGRYVPRRLVERLLLHGGGPTAVDERIMTVMFTDIVGYTRLCEGLSAREVAAFLNAHMTMLGECVETEGGTIDKYIGDALMAFWGAPEPIRDHAEAACRAAERIAAALKADNEERVRQGLAPVRLRIGIHTGPLIVGDIGSPSRVNYTVIGDTVNVASRLEDLGKEIDPAADLTVLFSDAVAGRLDGSWNVKFAGRYHVRGRSNEINVHRLIGRRAVEQPVDADAPVAG